jgi:hypothetical protein
MKSARVVGGRDVVVLFLAIRHLRCSDTERAARSFLNQLSIVHGRNQRLQWGRRGARSRRADLITKDGCPRSLAFGDLGTPDPNRRDTNRDFQDQFPETCFTSPVLINECKIAKALFEAGSLEFASFWMHYRMTGDCTSTCVCDSLRKSACIGRSARISLCLTDKCDAVCARRESSRARGPGGRSRRPLARGRPLIRTLVTRD